MLSVLAALAAAFMPITAASQIAPDKPPRTAPEAPYTKYELFAGMGYTSLDNVNQSRNGQIGVNLSVTRDWGKYFGITADGSVYKFTYDASNPGNPTVTLVLLGPVVHAHLGGKADIFFHVLMGGEHISGTPSNPAGTYASQNMTFASGYGGGFDYKLNGRYYVRAWGDNIITSIAANLPASCAGQGCSSHMNSSSRASIGVVYKF
jgi:hypothetical protein